MPSRPQTRIFLLSPASCSGRRAQLVLRPEASFDLACRLRDGGAPLGEVFTFLSGLYFRGKVAYATRFARPPGGIAAAHVITSSRGLLSLETIVTGRDLAKFDAIDIDPRERRYALPMHEAALALAGGLGADTEVVLLGSVASGKYTQILRPIFGARLRFPRTFVGRGDMSRGGLMLRAVRAGQELEYVPIDGTVLRGKRPPKLESVTGRRAPP